MNALTFDTPWLLALMLPAFALGWWQWRRRGRTPALAIAEAGPALAAAAAGAGLRLRLRWLPAALRLAAVLVLVIALARPRQGLALATIPEEGIDAVLALDVSSSMNERTQTGTPRIDAAKRVVEAFARNLEGDRVGLVVFQARALTLSPLTLDSVALARAVRDLRSGLLADGTAIGLGLAESLNLLRDSPARSRIVVLLTDGQNNSGEVTPAAAAELAKALGAKVYTVGFIEATGRGSNVDEASLRRIAEETGGRYFDAATQEELAAAYDEIGRLERSVVGERRFTRVREFGPLLAVAALGLLAGEALLRSTWLRAHP